MAKNNPLLKEAKSIAKKLKVSVVGWGDESIAFFEPKDKNIISDLKKQLGLIGFSYIQEEDDYAAGILTFVTANYKKIPTKNKKHLFATIKIIVIILAVSLFLFGTKLSYEAYLGYISPNWNIASAEISNLEILKTYGRGRYGKYEIRLEYIYQAQNDSKIYKGNNISYIRNIIFKNEAEAKRFLHYQVYDNRIKIYYNPSNHSQSVLVPGLNKRLLLLPLIMFFGAIILLSQAKKFGKNKSKRTKS